MQEYDLLQVRSSPTDTELHADIVEGVLGAITYPAQGVWAGLRIKQPSKSLTVQMETRKAEGARLAEHCSQPERDSIFKQFDQCKDNVATRQQRKESQLLQEGQAHDVVPRTAGNSREEVDEMEATLARSLQEQ